jgi:hypothetical protein
MRKEKDVQKILACGFSSSTRKEKDAQKILACGFSSSMRKEKDVKKIFAVLSVSLLVFSGVFGEDRTKPCPRIVRDNDPDWSLVAVEDAKQIVRIARRDTEIPLQGTGTVVSASCVLTAAHVMFNEGKLSTLPNLNVTVGGVAYSVLRYLIHPGYDPSSLSSDLALLLLDGLENAEIPPMEQSLGPPPVGYTAWICGFGYIGERGIEDFVPDGYLAKGKMTVDFLDASHIGGTLREGFSITAGGDSGSPLLVFDPSGGAFQAGVLSYGTGANLPDWRDAKTSHFTRTDVFREWISQGISDLENDVLPQVRSFLTKGKFALNFYSTTKNSLDVRIYSSEFADFSDVSGATVEVYLAGQYYDGFEASWLGNGKFYGDCGGLFSVSTRKGEIRYSIKGSSGSDLTDYFATLGISGNPGYFPVPVSIRIYVPRFKEYFTQASFYYRVSGSGGRGKY